MTLDNIGRFLLGAKPTWTDICRLRELREQIQTAENRIGALAGKDDHIGEKVILDALLQEQRLLRARLELL